MSLRGFFAALLLSILLATPSAAAEWTPHAYAGASTIELRTVAAGEGEHWFPVWRSEEHTSELQSLAYLVCRLLLEKKKNKVDNPRAYHTLAVPDLNALERFCAVAYCTGRVEARGASLTAIIETQQYKQRETS